MSQASWRPEVKKMNETGKTPARLINIYEYDDLSVDAMKRAIEKIIADGLEEEAMSSMCETG